jgi:ribose 5-phosphate isomerase B
MRIAIGGDHAGFHAKGELAAYLKELGHEVRDMGAHEYDSDDDYPDFTLAVAKAVASGEAERGVMVCGSGVGASVAANKVRGVRAAMCHDTYSAHQGVEHDDMNVLCLGARIVGMSLAKEVVAAYLDARFSGEERHKRRLEKVKAIEESTAAQG